MLQCVVKNSCLLLDRLKCGSMEYYDKSYDRVSTKNERPLKRINRIFHKVTTTDDPMIRQVSLLSHLGTYLCRFMKFAAWQYRLMQFNFDSSFLNSYRYFLNIKVDKLIQRKILPLTALGSCSVGIQTQDLWILCSTLGPLCRMFY